MSLKELSSSQWQELRDEHRNLVLPWITPRLERRSLHQSHPVDDFLFEYYPISTNKLLTWHPGFGYSLEATQIDFEEFPVGSYEYGSGQRRILPYWLVKNKEVAGIKLDPMRETADINESNGMWPVREMPSRFQLFKGASTISGLGAPRGGGPAINAMQKAQK